MSSRILVAIDHIDELDDSLAFAKPLAAHVAGFKVHSIIDWEGAKHVVPAFAAFGGKLMADMKIHDIPNTGDVRASKYLKAGADFLTVHASGGIPMMQRAVKATEGKTKILAISILTSHTPERAKAIYGDELPRKVLQLAEMALDAGCYGLVCSGQELEMLHEHLHLRELKFVVPGIRLTSGDAHDQKRVMTPDRAVKLGADYLVIGRAITQAEDPLAVVHQINELVASVS